MIGFLGGSGIYEALDLDGVREERVETPFGDPSAPLTIGHLGETEVAFLPRHGRNHEFSPTEVPYRANIHALKQVGVERVISSNAVGSLREELSPQTIVVPDGIFDRTSKRPQSFFEGEESEGIVVHMGFADPYCPHLADHVAAAASDALGNDSDTEAKESAGDAANGTERTDGTRTVAGGTYVCIEGPQFSTRAESEFYRAQGFDLVGMTAIPEAKLAREAELCYVTLAGVTDYDVWHDREVTLEEVLENAAANREAITAALREAISTLPAERECDCEHAISEAINTPTEAIPEETREHLSLLVGEYL
ncbi:S-methyl-5'-thioadenosine phosphorylase [Halobacteriales archaeon QS_3_64_16]|nr:MAG: S-methyl-5'-thioadenosine phosphorylase [Halobacteriales archaeon QS_3_64_16]